MSENVYVEYYEDDNSFPETYEMTRSEAIARFGEPSLDQGSEIYYF